MAELLDLGTVLAEREQPEESITFFLNEKLQYARSVLVEQAKSAKDPEVASELEGKIGEVDEALAESKYTLTLRGLPQRMREDINSKALAEFPVKPNFMGYDDSANAKARAEKENLLLLASSIVRLVKESTGAEKTQWTAEEVSAFSDTLSLGVLKQVDKVIKELAERVNESALAALDPSFG